MAKGKSSRVRVHAKGGRKKPRGYSPMANYLTPKKNKPNVSVSSFGSPKLNDILELVNRVVNDSPQSYTSTKTQPAYYNTGGFAHRPRKAFRMRRSRNITKANLKGVSRKFKSKVNKVLNHTKVFGEYHYITSKQLRQVDLESFNTVTTDERSNPFFLWTPYQIWNDYSVLFNNKSPAVNGNWAADITQGPDHNVSFKGKIHIDRAYANLFFKSTSNHVVNIEVIECTPRKDTDNWPTTYMDDSLNKSLYSRFTNGGGTGPLGLNYLGCPMSAFTELYKNFKVKIHTVKLLPGASSSLKIYGPKNYTVDGTRLTNIDTNNSADDTFPDLTKVYNNKVLIFRVMNDISVSGTTGKIHSWPSNEQGGVAMRMTRVTRFRPSSDFHSKLSDLNNTLWVQHVSGTAIGSVDQQVTYENPITVATNI